jgi:hypothetical protein
MENFKNNLNKVKEAGFELAAGNLVKGKVILAILDLQTMSGEEIDKAIAQSREQLADTPAPIPASDTVQDQSSVQEDEVDYEIEAEKEKEEYLSSLTEDFQGVDEAYLESILHTFESVDMSKVKLFEQVKGMEGINMLREDVEEFMVAIIKAKKAIDVVEKSFKENLAQYNNVMLKELQTNGMLKITERSGARKYEAVDLSVIDGEFKEEVLSKDAIAKYEKKNKSLPEGVEVSMGKGSISLSIAK